MIDLIAAESAATSEWPNTIFLLGITFLGLVLVLFVFAGFMDYRKAKLAAAQTDGLRQLVNRYEQLAENTLDAQQRVAAGVSELRSQTTAIEQILRTVE